MLEQCRAATVQLPLLSDDSLSSFCLECLHCFHLCLGDPPSSWTSCLLLEILLNLCSCDPRCYCSRCIFSMILDRKYFSCGKFPLYYIYLYTCNMFPDSVNYCLIFLCGQSTKCCSLSRVHNLPWVIFANSSI